MHLFCHLSTGAHCARVCCAPILTQRVHDMHLFPGKRCTTCTLTRQIYILTRGFLVILDRVPDRTQGFLDVCRQFAQISLVELDARATSDDLLDLDV